MSADLSKLEQHLATRSYIEGYTPSQADVHVFKAISSEPSASSNPAVARWYTHIKSYAAEHQSLPGSSTAGEAFIGGATAAPAEAEGDDEVDLFGSDDEEEDAEAERVKAERVAAYNAKKANKPKTVAKSIVTMDVKPWDDETDMEALKRPSGPLKRMKLQITIVVEDEKVSTDELQEQIAEFDDYVQSTDIAAMQTVYRTLE
ncbi:hypothetical protein BDQ17DRAFT_1432062 [Cyathus striatus]|nr:hypothetical protein BDQ17DRAFT_1432062 [Cyathus striatus]